MEKLYKLNPKTITIITGLQSYKEITLTIGSRVHFVILNFYYNYNYNYLENRWKLQPQSIYHRKRWRRERIRERWLRFNCWFEVIVLVFVLFPWLLFSSDSWEKMSGGWKIWMVNPEWTYRLCIIQIISSFELFEYWFC